MSGELGENARSPADLYVGCRRPALLPVPHRTGGSGRVLPGRLELETASVRRLSAAGWQDIPMAVEFRTWMSGVGGRRPRACHDASAGPRGHAGVMTGAGAASLQLTARGGLVSGFLTGDPVPFPGVINAPALA